MLLTEVALGAEVLWLFLWKRKGNKTHRNTGPGGTAIRKRDWFWFFKGYSRKLGLSSTRFAQLCLLFARMTQLIRVKSASKTLGEALFMATGSKLIARVVATRLWSWFDGDLGSRSPSIWVSRGKGVENALQVRCGLVEEVATNTGVGASNRKSLIAAFSIQAFKFASSTVRVNVYLGLGELSSQLPFSFRKSLALSDFAPGPLGFKGDVNFQMVLNDINFAGDTSTCSAPSLQRLLHKHNSLNSLTPPRSQSKNIGETGSQLVVPNAPGVPVCSFEASCSEVRPWVKVSVTFAVSFPPMVGRVTIQAIVWGEWWAVGARDCVVLSLQSGIINVLLLQVPKQSGPKVRLVMSLDNLFCPFGFFFSGVPAKHKPEPQELQHSPSKFAQITGSSPQ